MAPSSCPPLHRTLPKHLSRLFHPSSTHHCRSVSTAPQTTQKKEGDISSVFTSLSSDPSMSPPPLPARFAGLKSRLILDYEEAVVASWARLLSALKKEVQCIKDRERKGETLIPEIRSEDIEWSRRRQQLFGSALQRRGVGIVRGCGLGGGGAEVEKGC